MIRRLAYQAVEAELHEDQIFAVLSLIAMRQEHVVGSIQGEAWELHRMRILMYSMNMIVSL